MSGLKAQIETRKIVCSLHKIELERGKYICSSHGDRLLNKILRLAMTLKQNTVAAHHQHTNTQTEIHNKRSGNNFFTACQLC